jgi:hypothetical protein
MNIHAMFCSTGSVISVSPENGEALKVPFVAAVGLAAIERSRLNDLAYWRQIAARIAKFLPQRAAIAKSPAPSSKQGKLVP